MRMVLLLPVFLTLGLLGPSDALCDVKNGDTAVCHKLEDVKYIDSQNLTVLKAFVNEKTLGSTSLKNLPSSMKTLDLSDGKIEVIEPGTFLKMKGLQNLEMPDNSIAQLKESALDGLDVLKHFNLRRNNIRQLPSALTKLKALKNLEISGNPLACNCATLRVRDELLANGVKISKKVHCVTPSHFKGVSLLEPQADLICMFEEQDNEMQGDEAAGSGDGEDELSELTDVPPVPEIKVPDETDLTPEIITDDLIIPVLGRSGPSHSELVAETSTEANSVSDSSSSSTSSADDSTGDFEFTNTDEDEDQDQDDLIVEGSGATEPEEEGSGDEGSGVHDIWPPEEFDGYTGRANEPGSSTTEEPTTSTMTWLDVFWQTLTSDSDTTASNDNGVTEKSLTDEEFIAVTTEATTTQEPAILRNVVSPINSGVTEAEIVTKEADVQDTGVVPSSDPNSVTKSNKVVEDFSPADSDEDGSIDDVGEASTRQTKRSMGSYVVLAALLGVLAALIGFAAYKSSFCKKTPNSDAERGTEFKDMQKSLLDPSNTNQPKIASNGSTENAPLVDQTQDTWAGPQEIRRWADTNPLKADNGTKYTPPVVESDPVKPPRKSLPPQEETNGLEEVKTHAPMSTFAPRTHGAQSTPPNSPSSPIEDGNRSPPLSPNTQRVKITLQENPDSVPKTPILITRTKPGVNLVKTP